MFEVGRGATRRDAGRLRISDCGMRIEGGRQPSVLNCQRVLCVLCGLCGKEGLTAWVEEPTLQDWIPDQIGNDMRAAFSRLLRLTEVRANDDSPVWVSNWRLSIAGGILSRRSRGLIQWERPAILRANVIRPYEVRRGVGCRL